jgi:hypothetical protein
MNEDAKFEDGVEKPLRLQALDAKDLQVISALVQDAVFPITELKWLQKERRFAALLNRFRWEDLAAAKQRNRPVERVQSVLSISDVLKVSSQGIDRADKDLILSVLTIGFEPGADGTGRIELTLAGDGAVSLEVEAIDVVLQDVTRPYLAPSRKVPDHG